MSNSLLKKNIASNFAGSIWQALMGLAFVPVYIHFMGIASYGLVGIYVTIQGILTLLDIGIGSTLTREMARLSVSPDRKQEMRDIVRTLEIIYWLIAITACLIVVFSSSLMTKYWIKGGALPDHTVKQSLIIMGFIIFFQMPAGFYSNGLMGLQKQVILNIINSSISTIRGVGAIVVLWLFSPTIQMFLIWQVITGLINTLIIASVLWWNLPATGSKALFKKSLLAGIWRFAAGMSGTSFFSIILTQMDKIILSKLLSLEKFGYYVLASMIAMSLGRLFTPVFFSIYPRFTQLVAVNSIEELKKLYHTICQFLAVLILPAAVVLCFFSYEVILIWTQNPVTAANTSMIVSIMICGTALNGIINPAYALQLAYGWTKMPFYKNLIAVIVLAPLIVYSTKIYGAIGAASVWLILNMGFVFIEIPIMHRKLLKNEKWRWYFYDVCIPLSVSILIAGLCRIFFTKTVDNYTKFAYLFIISAITLASAVMATNATRNWLIKFLNTNRL